MTDVVRALAVARGLSINSRAGRSLARREYRRAVFRNSGRLATPIGITGTYALPRHDAFGAPLTITSSYAQMQNADYERHRLDDWSRSGARDGSFGS
jgi:hypothetical protein